MNTFLTLLLLLCLTAVHWTSGFPRRDHESRIVKRCASETATESPTQTSTTIRMAAFNIKTFGASKMSNAVVAEQIKKIVMLYDLILIQEIRDVSESAPNDLLNMLRSDGQPYEMALSERLGRTSYKEQYAYFYRTDKLQVLQTHQYADPGDKFEREPYSALFRAVDGTEFAVIGIHAKPDDAVEEIGLLHTVTEVVKSHWNQHNIVIMGDFNADCSYAREADLQDMAFYRTPYTWLVGMNADTTTSSTDCAYDRIVITGDKLESAVQTDALESDDKLVFRYDLHFGLSSSETSDVSDHYPVEISFNF